MDTTYLGAIAISLGIVLVISLVLVALGLALVMIPLMIWNKPAHALVVRNFVGYFSNPTGYVFLTLFVLLTSLATFVPDAFFNNNLASLEQLNGWMPIVLLAFIPAITMSIWAEEQQQGTDELLLTLPATDLDIVMGKYLAAAAVYTASLIFAMVTTFVVMDVLSLGDLDIGLFVASFCGYWLMGLAMLAVGMVASFFTSNLTVAFILGALFNLPLAVASSDFLIPGAKMIADTVGLSPEFPVNLARGVSQWSYPYQFQGFGQGAISFSAVIFFISVIVIGLYLSIVLIARRHWMSGPKSWELMGHFTVRTLALITIAIGLNYFFAFRDFRLDVTSQRVASLSSDARQLVGSLDAQKPVLIEAFIGQKIPTPYLKTRYDLISALQEFSSVSGGRVQVRIYDQLELSGDEASRAEKQFSIKPEQVQWNDHGVFRTDEVLLAAAITSGQKRITIPFFSQGIPVEYELARVIAGLTQAKKKLGILRTDVGLMSSIDPRQSQLIVQDLRQQYDVEDIDPSGEIVGREMDMLLAVQPSSLTPPQLENFIAAVESGIPTVIFEDAFPYFYQSEGLPGTDQPKMPRGQMAFMQQPQEKGDIRKLLVKLGVDFQGTSSSATPTPFAPPTSQAAVIWQTYNPYPQTSEAGGFPDQFVFIAPETRPPTEKPLEPFNQSNPAVKGFREVIFPFPGGIVNKGLTDIEFTPLVSTGNIAGRISFDDLRRGFNTGNIKEAQGKPDGRQYVLAAMIEGTKDIPAPPAVAKKDEKKDDKKDVVDKDNKEEKKETPRRLKVLLVSDVDLFHRVFVQMRARPSPSEMIDFRFQNVPFVLNLLDYVAGDHRFLEMRQRESHYVKLKLVELTMQKVWEKANEAGATFIKSIKDQEKQDDEKNAAEIEKLKKELQDAQGQRGIPFEVFQRKVQDHQIRVAQLEEESRKKQLESQAKLKKELERIRRESEASFLGIRNSFKMWAVLLPLIPPLLVALLMWIRARLREGDSVPRSRNIYTMRSEAAAAR